MIWIALISEEQSDGKYLNVARQIEINIVDPDKAYDQLARDYPPPAFELVHVFGPFIKADQETMLSLELVYQLANENALNYAEVHGDEDLLAQAHQQQAALHKTFEPIKEWEAQDV